MINPVLNTPYAMTKAAVAMLGRGLRVELTPENVAVGVTYWGMVDAELHQRVLRAPAMRELVGGFPARMARPISPVRAGEASARAIESRAARVSVRRHLAAVQLMRGLIDTATGAWRGIASFAEQSRPETGLCHSCRVCRFDARVAIHPLHQLPRPRGP